MSRGWKITLALTGIGFIAAVGLVAASNADDAATEPTSRLTRMEQSGEMSRIWEQHRQMLEQMQEDASPAMLERMERDPMWQMMRTPEWARMDEQHQRDIDRMFGE